MNKELIARFEKAVVDTVNVHYMLKCLYVATYDRNDQDILNILDEASYVFWDVVDAVKKEQKEFPYVHELMNFLIERMEKGELWDDVDTIKKEHPHVHELMNLLIKRMEEDAR